MNLRVFCAMVSAIALAPAALADYWITSRDQGNGDLYRYSNTGMFIAKIPGHGLVNGQGVAAGPNGNILVVNEQGNVLQYDSSTGAFLSIFIGNAVGAGPIAVGPDRNIYLGMSSDKGGIVEKYNGSTGADVGTFATGMSIVSGVAFGPNGNLFVSDNFSNTIRQFDATGAFVNDFATSATLNSGAGGLLFYGGFLVVSETFGPRNTWGNSIVKFNAANGACLGAFAGDSHLHGPGGFAAGPDGNLYVANFAADNILKYSPTGAFLGVFINTANDGALAPTSVAFLGGPASPTATLSHTSVLFSITILLLAIVMSVWFGWRASHRSARVRPISEIS
jgi:WD40 repeat protein